MYIWCAAIAGINKRGEKVMTTIPFLLDSTSEVKAVTYVLGTICPVEFPHLENIQVIVELVPMEWIKEVAAANQ